MKNFKLFIEESEPSNMVDVISTMLESRYLLSEVDNMALSLLLMGCETYKCYIDAGAVLKFYFYALEKNVPNYVRHIIEEDYSGVKFTLLKDFFDNNLTETPLSAAVPAGTKIKLRRFDLGGRTLSFTILVDDSEIFSLKDEDALDTFINDGYVELGLDAVNACQKEIFTVANKGNFFDFLLKVPSTKGLNKQAFQNLFNDIFFALINAVTGGKKISDLGMTKSEVVNFITSMRQLINYRKFLIMAEKDYDENPWPTNEIPNLFRHVREDWYYSKNLKDLMSRIKNVITKYTVSLAKTAAAVGEI